MAHVRKCHTACHIANPYWILAHRLNWKSTNFLIQRIKVRSTSLKTKFHWLGRIFRTTRHNSSSIQKRLDTYATINETFQILLLTHVIQYHNQLTLCFNNDSTHPFLLISPALRVHWWGSSIWIWLTGTSKQASQKKLIDVFCAMNVFVKN